MSGFLIFFDKNFCKCDKVECKTAINTEINNILSEGKLKNTSIADLISLLKGIKSVKCMNK